MSNEFGLSFRRFIPAPDGWRYIYAVCPTDGLKAWQLEVCVTRMPGWAVIDGQRLPCKLMEGGVAYCPDVFPAWEFIVGPGEPNPSKQEVWDRLQTWAPCYRRPNVNTPCRSEINGCGICAAVTV